MSAVESLDTFTPHPSWSHNATAYYGPNTRPASVKVDHITPRHRVASDHHASIVDVDAWLAARDRTCARRTYTWHKRTDGSYRAVVVHWGALGEVAWTTHYDGECLKRVWRDMYGAGEVKDCSRDAFRVFVFVGKVECVGVTG